LILHPVLKEGVKKSIVQILGKIELMRIFSFPKIISVCGGKRKIKKNCKIIERN
jgi:hypothetical protein